MPSASKTFSQIHVLILVVSVRWLAGADAHEHAASVGRAAGGGLF